MVNVLVAQLCFHHGGDLYPQVLQQLQVQLQQ